MNSWPIRERGQIAADFPLGRAGTFRDQGTRTMNAKSLGFRRLFFVPLVVVSLAALGCGGPLSVTAGPYNPSSVDAAEKAKVDQAEATAADAKKRSDDARAAIDVAKERAEAADKNVDDKDGALDIAKASLELEETKEGAGKGGQVASSKADVAAKTRELEIAEAEKDLAQTKITHSKASADEAEQAWLVALAELELAKHLATKGKGAEFDKLKADLEQQLSELRASHADAQKELAKAGQELGEAQNDLNKAKSGG
jgi:hypothetical protein